MYPLFFTDFIRHRTIQASIALCIFFEFVLSKSIKHTLILFGLPYLISIAMYYRYKPQKSRIKARISDQYKNTKYDSMKEFVTGKINDFS